MSVAIQKVPGVTSVEVSLKKGEASIQLKPGNTVRIEDITRKVKENGFNPKRAGVAARGELTMTGGKFQLRLSGADHVYELVPDSKLDASKIKNYVGKVVIVQGVVPPPTDKGYAQVIELKDLRQEL